MGKRKLVALPSLSPWCLVIVVWLFFGVPWVCLQFVIVIFPDHTHLLFWGFLKKGGSNQSPKLQRLARKWLFNKKIS